MEEQDIHIKDVLLTNLQQLCNAFINMDIHTHLVFPQKINVVLKTKGSPF